MPEEKHREESSFQATTLAKVRQGIKFIGPEKHARINPGKYKLMAEKMQVFNLSRIMFSDVLFNGSRQHKTQNLSLGRLQRFALLLTPQVASEKRGLRCYLDCFSGEKNCKKLKVPPLAELG